MKILAAILYFKMTAKKNNVLNIVIIRTGRMVILMLNLHLYDQRIK